MIALRLFAAAVLLSWAAAALPAPALTLDEASGRDGELLRDPGARLGIEEVTRAGAFVPLAGSLSAGYERDAAAARLTLWRPAVFAGRASLEYGLYGVYFGISAIIAAAIASCCSTRSRSPFAMSAS